MKQVIVGSRESTLAVMQTELVMKKIKRLHPEVELRLKTYKTTGDKILDCTLDEVGGKGLFTKELEEDLLEGKIDIAVHSLKDVPMESNLELPIVAVTKRGDPRDVFVLPLNHSNQEELNWSDMVVGASSLRRKLQLERLYQGVRIESIRGNIHTRLRKLDEGKYDGIILAAAGLIRSNLENRISRIFTIEEMLPAAGQGILAIQARKGKQLDFMKGVIDSDTMTAAIAERAFVRTLDGGCFSPAAAYATIQGDEIRLRGLYYKDSTKEIFFDSRVGKRSDASELGIELARAMKQKYGG